MLRTATLEIHICDQRRSYLVTFCSEEQAISFLSRKLDMNHAWFEIQETPVPRTWLKLLDYLYPECHHGLDASMCMDPIGPNHFGTMEQEMARGW